MMTFPNIVRKQGFIEVLLDCRDEKTNELTVEFVLDFDQFHEVIGIEILDLVNDAGDRCLQKMDNSGLNYSYDEECDAFNLCLSEGASLDQEAVDGTLLTNQKGQIIGFRAHFAN